MSTQAKKAVLWVIVFAALLAAFFVAQAAFAMPGAELLLPATGDNTGSIMTIIIVVLVIAFIALVAAGIYTFMHKKRDNDDYDE